MIEKPRPKRFIFGTPQSKLLRLGYVLIIIVFVVALSFYLEKLCVSKPQQEPKVPKEPQTVVNQSSSSEVPSANSEPSSSELSNSEPSESLGQSDPSLASTSSIKVIYELPVQQPVVYITIDDGWYPNDEVIKLMQQYHLPITTFLVEQAARKHPDFWHEFVEAGGHIEDHTIDHPYLTHLLLADQKKQISQPLTYFRNFDSTADELRPPYGDYNPEVEQAAMDSGIKYIVMWDAEMKNSVLSTRSGHELKSGDIILLHWVPGLDQELLQLLSFIQKKNLGIADLSQALRGEPLTISWLKTPIPLPKPVLPTTPGAVGSSESGLPEGATLPKKTGTPALKSPAGTGIPVDKSSGGA